MIVRFNFHHNVDGLGMCAIAARRGIGEIAHALRAFDDRCIIAIGRDHAARMQGMGVANHAEQ